MLLLLLAKSVFTLNRQKRLDWICQLGLESEQLCKMLSRTTLTLFTKCSASGAWPSLLLPLTFVIWAFEHLAFGIWAFGFWAFVCLAFGIWHHIWHTCTQDLPRPKDSDPTSRENKPASIPETSKKKAFVLPSQHQYQILRWQSEMPNAKFQIPNSKCKIELKAAIECSTLYQQSHLRGLRAASSEGRSTPVVDTT